MACMLLHSIDKKNRNLLSMNDLKSLFSMMLFLSAKSGLLKAFLVAAVFNLPFDFL